MKKVCKSILSLMLTIVVVMGVMSPVVTAADDFYFKEHLGDSDMWLVDANTKKTASTIYLYGRADYICLKLKKDSGYYASFYFKMYSDSKYKKEVASYSTGSESGTNYVTIPISFDDLKSGTYYVKTYVYKETFRSNYYYNETSVDPETERTYKIVINKKGTDVDDMNTVMYGYENTEKGPRIYWYSVPGAKGYYLYRKSPKTGKYSKIKTVKDSGDKFTGYTDTTYKGKNATRYYKVVAYKGSLKTPSSLKSIKVRALKTPTVKAEVISNNRIKVSWSKVSSNASYTIFYRHNDSSKWKEVKTVNKKTSCVIDANKFDNNEVYRFTVIANVDGVPSGYNTKGVARRFLEYPELKPCTYPEGGGITVNWKAVSGTDGYKVYRKLKSTADWVEIAEVDGKSTTKYTDSKANNKDLYYYTVRSMRKGVNGSMDVDGVSATILSQPVLTGIQAVDGQSIKISWEKIPNDCKYVVMMKTTDGWDEIATTKKGSYTYNMNSKIFEGTFTVKATRSGFTSTFDKNGVTYFAYPQVLFTDVEVKNDGATLKWKKPTNAENSVVYKKIGDGDYELLADTDAQSLVDSSVEPGVNYTYKIAYKYNGEIIENAAIEQPLCINTDVVERAGTAYGTTYSYVGYRTFTTKIKNYDSTSKYYFYHMTDNGWKRLPEKPDSSGKITVKSSDFTDVERFAIVRITPQGDCTLLFEPDFTVYFASDLITNAEGCVENGYPSLKWDLDLTKTGDNIHIYRKAPDSKDVYKRVGIVPATETSFVDKSAKSNYFYDYQLRVENDGFITYGGPIAQVNYMGAPVFEIHNFKGGTALRWSKVSRAEKYVVYKKLSSAEEWTEIATTTATDCYYEDKKDKKFVGVMYMVVAIDENGNQSPAGLSGEWIYVPSVSEFEVKNESKNNKLTWKAVEGADGYLITYDDYNIKKGKWGNKKTIKVTGGSKSSYTDKNVPANVLRRYRIEGVYKGFSGVYSIDGGGYISTQPKITSIKSTNNGVKMKFSKITGVSEYVVYRKGPGDAKWKKIKTVSSRSYTDSSVKKGKTYSYTVKAKFDSINAPIYSTYNSKGWSITYNP